VIQDYRTALPPKNAENFTDVVVAFQQEDEDELINSTPSPGTYKRENA